MTNLEWLNKIGMIAENKFYAADEKECLNLVIALRDSDFENYKKLGFEWLLKEHKEPIKLKKWESHLIKAFDANNYTFEYFVPLKEFKKIGYFSGVKDVSMKLGDILDNCEIVPDDYDFGGKEE